MKKWLSFLLILAILLGTTALAEEGSVAIDGTASRKIKIHKTGDNSVADGISPTTGRVLSEVADGLPDNYSGMAKSGTYYPMLVQISNPNGGIGANAPWYLSYADIVYETPLEAGGTTRHVAIFNDVLPELVGPCRSIRVHHMALQAEWDCPYVFHGMQEQYVKPLISQLRKTNTGLNYKADGQNYILYDGKDNQDRFYNADGLHFRVTAKGMESPNNSGYRLADLVETVVPKDQAFNNHTYKFLDFDGDVEKLYDVLPQGGDDASFIYVDWNLPGKTGCKNNSRLEYDPEENVYYRYVLDAKTGVATLYDELLLEPTGKSKVVGGSVTIPCDISHGNPITFTNVIVQAISIKWSGGGKSISNKVLPIGTGNADYFMGGQHYKGVWNRDTVDDRTVFYDENGYELSLLPGKTLIIMIDYENGKTVSYDP